LHGIQRSGWLADARSPQRATEEKNMRELRSNELELVSGAGNKPASHPYPSGQEPSKRNPAHAPGESYKGSADKNFGPQ
jgi:hypothetical protein